MRAHRYVKRLFTSCTTAGNQRLWLITRLWVSFNTLWNSKPANQWESPQGWSHNRSERRLVYSGSARWLVSVGNVTSSDQSCYNAGLRRAADRPFCKHVPEQKARQVKAICHKFPHTRTHTNTHISQRGRTAWLAVWPTSPRLAAETGGTCVRWLDGRPSALSN